MSRKELRRHCHLGGEAMRITVVGAVLIGAAVIAALVLMRRLVEKGNRGTERSGEIDRTGRLE